MVLRSWWTVLPPFFSTLKFGSQIRFTHQVYQIWKRVIPNKLYQAYCDTIILLFVLLQFAALCNFLIKTYFLISSWQKKNLKLLSILITRLI
jgi:hypothetical protein